MQKILLDKKMYMQLLFALGYVSVLYAAYHLAGLWAVFVVLGLHLARIGWRLWKRRDWIWTQMMIIKDTYQMRKEINDALKGKK